MPSFTGYYRNVRICQILPTSFQLLDSQLHNLALDFLTFLITRVEMRGQSLCLMNVAGAEKLDHSARRVHPSGCVDSRSNTKANVVGGHTAAVPATAHFHQRTQARVRGFRQIVETKRDNGPVFTC